jgi:hypothetical protein
MKKWGIAASNFPSQILFNIGFAEKVMFGIINSVLINYVFFSKPYIEKFRNNRIRNKLALC